MNYTQIAILLLQGTLVVGLILFLFRLRKKLGIGTLFACLGLFQFVQVFLSSNYYVTISDNFVVSPGSSVLFTATLFALLIIYIKEDASETKKIIYALLIVNTVMTILLLTFGWNFKETSTYNTLMASTNLFDVSAWVLFVGTIALFLDSLLIIILFEFISKKLRFLFLQICITMVVVVSFDTIFFSIAAFWSFDNLNTILISGIISKGFIAIFYSVLFYIYLKYFDSNEPISAVFKIKDVFQPLTYKQKFESAILDIKEAKEERENELDISNREKEIQIAKLELSKQKIETTLALLEKSEHSKNEASKIAKIGYWENDFTTGTIKWSDYVHQIYGSDPQKKPEPSEIIKNFDTETKNKFTLATQELTLKGIPYDIELKFINLKNQEVWVRSVAQPIYNEQNEIVGRRGTIQDITDAKRAQLELEHSKQKIESSLKLLEKRDYSLNEISKVAKIGYHEYYLETDAFIASDYIYDIFGLPLKSKIPPREEMIALFDEESQQKIQQANLDLYAKSISYDIELKLINLKKQEVWVRNVSQPIYNQQNEIIGRRGVLQDITATKNAQLELELSKQKIQESLYQLEKSEYSKNEASKVAKVGYVEYDIATDTLIWSEYMYHIFGVDTKDPIPSRKEITALFTEESQKKLEKATLEHDTLGTPFDLVLKMFNFKNEEIWTRILVHPIYNKENKVIKRRGVLQDITASKKAQLQLEFSKNKLQQSLELLEKSEHSKNEASRIAKIGHWEYIIATDTFIWSDYVYQVYGLELNATIPSREEVVKLYDTESQKVLMQATLDLDLKGIPYDVELKLINFKKEEVWVRNVVHLTYNQQNEIIGRRGVVQNITTFKNSQLELEASLKLLEKSEYSKNEASKVAKIGYWEYDNATGNLTWSDYIYQIFGIPPTKTPPPLSETAKFFDEESQKKIAQVTLNLSTKGIPYDIELKFINHKNEEAWIRTEAHAVFNELNEIIGRRGITQDITEAKKAQIELELSKQKIQTSLELLEKSEYSKNEASKIARIGYGEYDIVTSTLTWSEYMYHIYGLDSKDPIPPREEIVAFYDKESQEKLTKATLKLDTLGTPFDLELKMINFKKEEIWVRILVGPVFNKQNKTIIRRGVLQDITESKKAQIELELSKQKIQATLDIVKENEYSLSEAGRMAKIGYWKYEKESDTLFWSDTIHEIFGTDPKKGTPERNIIINSLNEESRIKLLYATEMLVTKGIPFDIELQVTSLKNEKIWLRNIGEPLYNDKNEIIGRRGVMQDITLNILNQKSLDQKNLRLYELNEALNLAQKLSHVGSWQWDMTTDKAEWSDEMYAIYGVTKGGFYPSNENITKTVLPEDMHKVEKGMTSLLVNNVFVPFEFRIKRPSGEIRYLYIQALEKKSKEKVFGVTMDVTERRLIEEKNLRITEEYRVLFENATISIWNEDLTEVFDEIEELKKLKIPDTKIYLEQNPEVLFSLLSKIKVNSVNKATLKLFKAKSIDEFTDNIQNLFGEGADKVIINLIESIWKNKKTFTSEINYKKLNGDEFRALLSIPIPQTRIKQKSVPISIQSIQSIVEAKLAKKESINKLNEAQKLAHIGSWVYNPLTNKNDWSDEMFNIWGFNLNKQAPDYEVVLERIHKDDLDFYNKSIADAMNKGTSYDIEFRIVILNQEIKTLRAICKPILDKHGKVVHLTGTYQDITEQKRISREIQKAEEMYRILTDNSNDLICLQEPNSTFKYISPSIKNLLGYEPSDFLGKQVFSIVHKEDVKPLQAAMKERLFKGKTEEAYTFRIRHKKGYYVWFEFLTSPVYSSENEISYFVTSARDITQWILAKEEIQEYQTSLQKLTTELTLIEEKQKKEIALNIHDHLSQSLVISKMRLNVLKKNPDLKFINDDLKFIESQITDALHKSRKITFELSPTILYQLGLIDALTLLTENIEENHKIMCSFNSNVSYIELSEIKSILLYRSVQEIIVNAIKYANASLITLDLFKNKSGINILITDNGIGFDTKNLTNKFKSGSGFGLFTVQERIKNIQGEFSIMAKRNIGTKIKIIVPLTE